MPSGDEVPGCARCDVAAALTGFHEAAGMGERYDADADCSGRHRRGALPDLRQGGAGRDRHAARGHGGGRRPTRCRPSPPATPAARWSRDAGAVRPGRGAGVDGRPQPVVRRPARIGASRGQSLVHRAEIVHLRGVPGRRLSSRRWLPCWKRGCSTPRSATTDRCSSC
jgi:hypothetical protein